MQWNFHGGAKVEHLEAEETCKVPLFYYFSAWFEMKACMYLCENLGGSRAPIDALPSSSSYSIWVPIHDQQNEGEWRDFYDNKVLNFTLLPWVGNEPNGGTTENCAMLGWRGWYGIFLHSYRGGVLKFFDI